MATVFLSYDHDDVERAAPLATALEKAGHSVWWDRQIHGGAEFNSEIEAAVQAADAVVVLWSEGSVRSPWVRDEAAEGRDQGKLVPVLIDPVKPPMGFRQFQTIDLSRASRASGGAALRQILDSVDKVTGMAPRQAPALPAKPSRRFARIDNRTVIAVAAFALLVIAILVGWNLLDRRALPVVLVAPSDSSERSASLSRDLFVKLGSLAHVGESKWRLADPRSAPSDPDLVFQVAEVRSAGVLHASLVLIEGKQDSLLWSRQFEQAAGSEEDVRQRASLAAGLALICALETREAGGLPLDLFKLYLASCTGAAEGSNQEPDKTVAAMRSIIAQKPDFAPAWGQLVAAQADFLALSQLGGLGGAEGPRRTLLKYLEEARKVDPKLPEIGLVEINLLPATDYAGKLRRIEQSKAQAPANAAVWGVETRLLESVGRMVEAVASARRTAELEPLSPGAANQVITTLAYAGQIDEARKELARAERNWAGTGALQDVQWAFHLRFGDPKIAMQLRGQVADVFLRARLDPSPKNVAALIDELAFASASNAGEFGYAVQALAEFDKTDEVYKWLARVPAPTLSLHSYLLFRPALDDVRRDVRFMAVAKRIGLLGYWRESGRWPDFCYDPKLPYDCRKEGSRLAA